MSDQDPHDRSLDPLDWERYREVSHRVLDELLDFVQTVGERGVWQPVPDAVKERLTEGAPRGAQPVEQVWESIQELILPYPTGNIHPRFFGWVHGSGTVGGILAEMTAAAMNSNLGGREHGA